MIEPKITKLEKLYSLRCRVDLRIDADPSVIWRIITDAPGYPRWNSTVTRIDGEIREGGRIRISVPESRQTFSPKISGLVPMQRMDWTGGISPLFKGQRRFELNDRGDGSSDFAMQEHFSGIVFMMVKRSMPNFGPIFARFAQDLKIEAERQASGGEPMRPASSAETPDHY